MTLENSIFISYNPNNEQERILATGLFKKGRQNGHHIYLPERNSLLTLNNITKERIDKSEWFVVFCFDNISETIISEINQALKNPDRDRKKIVVVLSDYVDQKLSHIEDFAIKNKITLKTVEQNDFNQINKFTTDLITEIVGNKKNKTLTEDNNILKFVLGVGVAALLIKLMSNSKA